MEQDQLSARLSRLLKDPRQVIKSQILLRTMKLLGKDARARRIGLWTFGKLERVAFTDLFPDAPAIDALNIRWPFARQCDTSIDLEELLLLIAILKTVGARNVLEIGTFDGNTTLNIAANLADEARVVTVDLPQDWDGQYRIQVPGDYVNVTDRTLVGKKFINTPWSHKVTQVFGDSAGLDWSTLGGPFNVVFIDGCHHYHYVRQDTANALRHLAPRGILVWHDYGMIEDVSRAVDEAALKFTVRAVQGSRLAVGWPDGATDF